MSIYRLARIWRVPAAAAAGVVFCCHVSAALSDEPSPAIESELSAAGSDSDSAAHEDVETVSVLTGESVTPDNAWTDYGPAFVGPPAPDETNPPNSPAPQIIATDKTDATGAEMSAPETESQPEPPGESTEVLDYSAGPPESLAVRIDPCRQFDGSQTSLLDKQQVFVYRTVCGATAWFDGFFGDRRYDQATGQTFGRITIGGYWDERDGWDSKLRFRAKFALPSLRNRGSLLVGRGDEQDLIEERDTSGTNPVPVSPNTGEDDSTFVGFGFDSLRKLSKALSFSVGVKLHTPPEPFVKVKYRRAWQLSDRNLLRVRPIVYWRSEEGLGSTLNVDIDHVLSNEFLFRWSNFGNVSQDEEVEGVDWGSTFYLFQALSNKRAMTYSLFARGETDADITFKNAGFEIRYRRNIFREWLFLETGGGVSWPRYSLDEQRKANFGIGMAFQAYFGPAPEDWMYNDR